MSELGALLMPSSMRRLPRLAWILTFVPRSSPWPMPSIIACSPPRVHLGSSALTHGRNAAQSLTWLLSSTMGPMSCWISQRKPRTASSSCSRSWSPSSPSVSQMNTGRRLGSQLPSRGLALWSRSTRTVLPMTTTPSDGCCVCTSNQRTQ